MVKRLGMDVGKVLEESVQPKMQVGLEWAAKPSMEWRRQLLEALADLVWYEITQEEMNARLSEKVSA